jgi:hypothetical protein
MQPPPPSCSRRPVCVWNCSYVFLPVCGAHLLLLPRCFCLRCAAAFENTVQALYKYVVPKPRSECSKYEQLTVSFAAGYIAGVFCAVVSHPAGKVGGGCRGFDASPEYYENKVKPVRALSGGLLVHGCGKDGALRHAMVSHPAGACWGGYGGGGRLLGWVVCWVCGCSKGSGVWRAVVSHYVVCWT